MFESDQFRLFWTPVSTSSVVTQDERGEESCRSAIHPSQIRATMMLHQAPERVTRPKST